MTLQNLLLSLFLLCCGPALAATNNPLGAEIDASDAHRFARLMQGEALPTADDLQRGYLDGAGLGVRIFTPMRIVDAQRLAGAVARKPDAYRYAIRECLPRLQALRADLQSIYLAFNGLLPERPLPAVKVVFGALNSGGTASDVAQVIGLEVVCPPGTTPEQLRISMRGFFAHETVHTWQQEPTPQALADPLLGQALREGVADYLATLVTGEIPVQQRDAWARPKEAWLWQEFERDRKALQGGFPGWDKLVTDPRFTRWFSNCRTPPEGWPCEAGYWIGMRIAEGYVRRAPDRYAAVRELLILNDPGAILKASGYGL